MDDFFLNAPIENLELHLGRLRAALDELYSTQGRLTELQQLDETVAALEEAARAELVSAELTDELGKLEDSLRPSYTLRDALTRELSDLIGRLITMLEESAGLADQTTERFEAAISAAMKALQQKRAGLEAVMHRVKLIRLEREKLQSDLPSVFEETMPFDPTQGLEPSQEDLERRRHRRDDIAITVQLEGPNRLLSGSTENVSVGGVFIATPHDFELGTLIHVTCGLPDGRTVEGDGIVSWKRQQRGHAEPGVGVEFLAMAESDRRILDEVAGDTLQKGDPETAGDGG